MAATIRYSPQEIGSFYRPGCADFREGCPVFDASEHPPLDLSTIGQARFFHWDNRHQKRPVTEKDWNGRARAEETKHVDEGGEQVFTFRPSPKGPAAEGFAPVLVEEPKFVYEAQENSEAAFVFAPAKTAPVEPEKKDAGAGFNPVKVHEEGSDGAEGKVVSSFNPVKEVFVYEAPAANQAASQEKEWRPETEPVSEPRTGEDKPSVNPVQAKQERGPARKNNPFVYLAPPSDDEPEEEKPKAAPPNPGKTEAPVKRQNPFVYIAPDDDAEQKEEKPKAVPSFNPKRNNQFRYQAPDVPEEAERVQPAPAKKVVDFAEIEKADMKEPVRPVADVPKEKKQKVVPSFNPKPNPFVYRAPDVDDQPKTETKPVAHPAHQAPSSGTAGSHGHNKNVKSFAELQEEAKNEKGRPEEIETPKEEQTKRTTGFHPKKAQKVYEGVDLEDQKRMSQKASTSGKSAEQAVNAQPRKKVVDFASIEKEQREQEKGHVVEEPNEVVTKKSVPAFSPWIKPSMFHPPSIEETVPRVEEKKPVPQPDTVKAGTPKQAAPVKKESIIDKFIAEEEKKMAEEKAAARPVEPEVQQSRPKPSFNPKPSHSVYEGPSVEQVDKAPTRKKGRRGKAIVIGQLGNVTNWGQDFNYGDDDDNDEKYVQPKKKTGPSFDELMKEQAMEAATEKREPAEEHVEKKTRPPAFNPKRKQAPTFDQIWNEQQQSSAKDAPPTVSSQSFAPRQRSAVIPFEQLMKLEEEKAAADSEIAKPLAPAAIKPKEASNWQPKRQPKHTEQDEELFWGTVGELVKPRALQDEEWPAFDQPQSNPKPKPKPQPQPSRKRLTKEDWLAQTLRDELGDDDWTEFATSIANKQKDDVIRHLSTVTTDRPQAVRIADTFFRRFPS